MFWFFFGIVAKLGRHWLCTPVIEGSSPSDSIKIECRSRNDERRMERCGSSSSLIALPSALTFAGVAQWARERSPGTTEAVSSILTTGSNISGCRVEATHLPWEQVHAGSIPAIQTKVEGGSRNAEG